MSLYDIKIKTIEGEEISMEKYKGKVVLIVNTASRCGFTPQFEELEKIYKANKENGFVVLGFPCNQFKEQDPGTSDEIKTFCSLNYGVSFPMFEKIDVNGENEHELYTYLKSKKSGIFGKNIKWNFTKFLIDRDGNVVDRFAPTTNPLKFEKDIKKLLDK